MKVLLISLWTLFITAQAQSQTVNKLFGAHANGTGKFFSSINLPAFSYNQISSLNNNFNPSKGETTFDEIQSRYFTKSGSDILIINALNGAVSDTIKNAGSFYNMEYDRVSNKLVGIGVSGNSITFKTCNLTTKVFTTKGSLLFDSIVKGESTFDPIGRRYFVMSNLGLTVIDSSGVLKDVLCAAPGLNGIEYDTASKSVYYLEWKGGGFDFTSVDAISCTIGIISSLTSDTSVLKGESTFDQSLGYYYSQTNLGIVQIDTKTGAVIQHTATNNFAQMEFARIPTTGIWKDMGGQHVAIFPNPSTGKFNFSNLTSGSTFEVYSGNGLLIIDMIVNDTKITIDLEREPRGIYFYRIRNSAKGTMQGKLVLK